MVFDSNMIAELHGAEPLEDDDTYFLFGRPGPYLTQEVEESETFDPEEVDEEFAEEKAKDKVFDAVAYLKVSEL